MNEEILNLIRVNKTAAIIFDFDGTLVESTDIKAEGFKKLYAPYGEHIVNQVLKYHFANEGIPRVGKIRYMHEKFLHEKISEESIKMLSEQFSAFVKQKVIEAPAVKGVLNFINYCALNKIALFIASAMPQQELEEIVKARGWLNNFKHVYGAPINKPEAIKIVIEQNDIPNKNILMIGDALADHDAAIQNGVPFCARITDSNMPLFKDRPCIKIKYFE